MSHRLIFSLLLVLFYGLIFFRVEHWPFTDWGVYAYRYHPEKVFVFDLSLKDSEPNLAANLLENLGQSPVTFNAMITRSYLKKDEPTNKPKLSKLTFDINSNDDFPSLC